MNYIVNIGNKMTYCKGEKCKALGRRKEASYNIVGETKAAFCKECSLEGMVDYKNKNRRCEYPACKTQSSYNYLGETVGQYCVLHKLPDMIDILSKKCKEEGCNSQPSYNYPGKKTGVCCAKHREEGMIDIWSKLCKQEGCDNQPSYNLPGCKKAEYCSKHKTPDMIDLVHKLCDHEGCKIQPSYGFPGQGRTRCAKHKEPGMIKRTNGKCKECKERAIYGTNYTPLHCEDHKKEGEINYVEKECSSCNLMTIISSNGLCELCNPETIKRVQLAKQNDLLAYLTAQELIPDTIDKQIDNGVCGKERPDFVYNFGHFILIVECDEHQHRDRNCECEQIRMVNIGQSFGGIPVYFIRFNPDDYKPLNPKKELVPIKERYAELGRIIKAFRDEAPTITPICLVCVVYIYYDSWDGMNKETWTVLS